MIVCLCRNVSDRAVARAVDRGARTVADVACATGAGTGCGCCRETVEALLEARGPCGSGGCEACPRRAAAAAVDAP
jgi:assimilatory nitrate reductase electron transfer subunit